MLIVLRAYGRYIVIFLFCLKNEDLCRELVCNIYDKKNYVAHKKALTQAFDYGLVLEKMQRVIEFNQEAWLKSYVEKRTQN